LEAGGIVGVAPEKEANVLYCIISQYFSNAQALFFKNAGIIYAIIFGLPLKFHIKILKLFINRRIFDGC
jgi:hypothetical protein